MSRWMLLLFATGCTATVDGWEGVAEEPEQDEVVETEDEDTAELGALALTLDEGLDVEERIFLQKINEYRAANGLAPLQASVALSRAADFHSVDMATKNYFSHTSQDGTSWSARIKRYYNYSTYLAENIAAGNAGGDATFVQWKNSPGHDANMKSANYRVIGIGRAYNAAATYRWYWTTDFGGYVDEVMTPGGEPPPPPPPATNLLANGTFDGDELTAGVVYTSIRTANRWHWGSQAGSATLTASAAAASTRGLRVVDVANGSISVGQLAAATPGKSYTLAAKVRRVSGQNGQVVYLDFLNATYGRIGRSTLSAGTGTTFHDITRTAVAPAGAAYVRVTIYGYAGNNDYASTYDWDELVLTAQ